MASLRAVDCREFIKVVVDKAAEMQVPISVAVVNEAGHIISLERMDDAGWLTAEIAWGKAYTAAAFRAMSPRFPDGLLIQQWFKERNPQMMMNSSYVWPEQATRAIRVIKAIKAILDQQVAKV